MFGKKKGKGNTGIVSAQDQYSLQEARSNEIARQYDNMADAVADGVDRGIAGVASSFAGAYVEKQRLKSEVSLAKVQAKAAVEMQRENNRHIESMQRHDRERMLVESVLNNAEQSSDKEMMFKLMDHMTEVAYAEAGMQRSKKGKAFGFSDVTDV